MTWRSSLSTMSPTRRPSRVCCGATARSALSRPSYDYDQDVLLIGDRKVSVTSTREPATPWDEHAVDVVVESTGKFRTRDAAAAHLAAGARRVVLSAPGKGVDATIVMGVNDETYDPERLACRTRRARPTVWRRW